MSDSYDAIRDQTKALGTKTLSPADVAALAQSYANLPTNGARQKPASKPQPHKKKYHVDDNADEDDKKKRKERFEDLGPESSEDDDDDDDIEESDEGGAEDENEGADEVFDADAAEDGGPGADDMQEDQTHEKQPKKRRAPRSAPDSQSRAQNTTALNNLRKGDNYKKESISARCKTATVAVTADYYSDVKSTMESGMWSDLVNGAAHKIDMAKYDPHVSGLDWTSAPTDVVSLANDMNVLLNRAVACNNEIQQFKDTYLQQASAIKFLERNETIAEDAPQHCCMCRLAVPAKNTIRVEITYENPKTATQTLVVASNFKDLIKALVFVIRIPASVQEAALPALQANNAKKLFVAGEHTIKYAVEVMSAKTGSKSAHECVTAAFERAVTAIGQSTTKFANARRTQLAAESVAAAAEPTPAPIVF